MNTKLPAWLERVRDELALAHSKHPIQDNHASVIYAFDACYAALLAKAPEFPEKAALDKWANLDAGKGETWDYVDGARWQHDQLKAQLAAKDAELEKWQDLAAD